jgi:hypothetical protein
MTERRHAPVRLQPEAVSKNWEIPRLCRGGSRSLILQQSFTIWPSPVADGSQDLSLLVSTSRFWGTPLYGAELMARHLRSNVKREYAYGPAQGLLDSKVFRKLCDEAKKGGWL